MTELVDPQESIENHERSRLETIDNHKSIQNESLQNL